MGILQGMFSRFTLGDTLSLTKTLAAYPATAGWVLYYRLVVRDGAGAAITFNSMASGSDHLITVPAATTAAWVAGTYTWASWVSDGVSSYSVEHGSTDLLSDPRTTSSPLDLRTAAQTALDNVRLTIQGKASADVLRYEINGRMLERYPRRDLLALEANLVARVNAEQRAAALAAGRPDTRMRTVRLGRA